MTTRLTSIAAIAVHRRDRGDAVEARDNRLIAVARIGARLSSVELRWQASTGSLHLFEVLPFDVPVPAITAVAAAIMQANSQLAVPGFQLRRSPAGWRVVFLAYAFLDEEHAISARAIDELIRTVRINAAAYLPQFTAVVADAAAAGAGVEASALARFGRREARLAPSEVARLRQAVERDAPDFAPRLAGAQVTAIEQPFFTTSTILEVASPMPAPARIVYCARAANGDFHVLTGRLDALREVCRVDPPRLIGDRDGALVFANIAAVWSADPLGELRISTLDEIPWRTDLSGAERARVDALRAAVGRRIAAPSIDKVERGHRLHYWCVTGARLVRREIVVTTAGDIEVDAEVIGDVPVYPGRVWSMIDGRLVPTG